MVSVQRRKRLKKRILSLLMLLSIGGCVSNYPVDLSEVIRICDGDSECYEYLDRYNTCLEETSLIASLWTDCKKEAL